MPAKSRIVRILLIAVILLSLCAQAFAGSTRVYINASTKIYSSPSTSASSLKVGKNTPCYMTAYRGNWAQVKNGNITAYVPLQYITLVDTITGYAARDCKVYKSASSSKKLCSIGAGTKLCIIGRDGDYYRISNGSSTGYIKASDVSSSKPAVNKAAYLAAGAKSLVGRPYSTSCNPPKSFDCSHFVIYCYKQLGIKISGDAKKIGYNTKYKHITDRKAVAVGDIVCFNTINDADLCDHLGIYIGNGQFVHASSGAGQVTISSMSSGFYKDVFVWSLRLL